MDRALLRGPSYGDELKAWSVRLARLGPTPRLGTLSRIYATMLFVRTATNHEENTMTTTTEPAAAYAAYAAAYDVLEAAEDSYKESVEGWNRAAAMDALDMASEAYAIAKKAWQEQVLALR